jgi:predicted O-methyltransferase YrrM
MDAYKLAEISVFRGACQKMRELTPLVSLLKRRKLYTVIEIGTMKGGTLWLWCQLAMADAVVISVDLPDGEFGGGYKAKDIKRFRAYAQAEQSLHFIRKDSHRRETKNEVAKKLNGRAVDLVFIDGDHRHRGVQKDFEMYAPFVRNGGIVLFHDILPHPKVPICGVYRFWSEIKVHFKHREFIEEDDDRGWGEWGGIGMLSYTQEAYNKALQRTLARGRH